MQEVKAQGRIALKSLQAAYEGAWCHYLAEVSRWQSLQTVSQSNATQVGQAEIAANAAEEGYRQARNRLAEYMLHHRSHPNLAVHDELQPELSHFRDTRSTCFDCA